MPEIWVRSDIAGYSVLMILAVIAVLVTIYDKIEMRKRRKTHKK